LGMHPMFGNSNPIPSQTVIICPTKKSGKWSKWMRQFLVTHKVDLQTMTAKQHDQIMNIAQGLVHFTEIAFADALRRTKMPVEKLLKYTGKASELKIQLAARLISQDPELYGLIQINNAFALTSLKHLQTSVNELIKIVAEKDIVQFKKVFVSNKKFLGSYAKEAYSDSSYLIDQLMNLHQSKAKNEKIKKPSKQEIGLLGPKNTYSDLALRQSKLKDKPYYASSINEVFELVAKGKLKAGLVPIENSLTGSVRETLDELYKHNVWIEQVIAQPIHLALAANKIGALKSIQTIFSHPQALLQCRNFLKRQCPKAQAIPVASTTEALERARQENQAAVAAPFAIRKHAMKIIQESIEDDHTNTTYFALITKSSSTRPPIRPSIRSSSRPPTSSIAFNFSKDSSGSLYTILGDFAEAKINLTKIESRPNPSMQGQYVFYIDFEGGVNQLHIKKTLTHIQQKVDKLKILGCY
jgi:prephenate dehydratase